jgi:hypothetical protein
MGLAHDWWQAIGIKPRCFYIGGIFYNPLNSQYENNLPHPPHARL